MMRPRHDGHPRPDPALPAGCRVVPGAPLPLHIFEERYKLMVRRCIDEHLEFGVVLAREGGVAPVGCTAEILKVVKEYPDGRMDILAAGQTPCHLLEIFEEKAYLEANVEYLDDDPRPPSREIQEKLGELYGQCHTLVFGHPPPAVSDPPTESIIPLSFRIAGLLPLDPEYKQEVLEIQSEAERQTHLVERLEQWLPQLVRIERVRKKTGGNGHGLG
jgi:Lon protease-like protein